MTPEEAIPADDMIEYLVSQCFIGNKPCKYGHTKDSTRKPNHRVVYTIPIWGDFYLDINVIQPHSV